MDFLAALQLAGLRVRLPASHAAAYNADILLRLVVEVLGLLNLLLELHALDECLLELSTCHQGAYILKTDRRLLGGGTLTFEIIRAPGVLFLPRVVLNREAIDVLLQLLLESLHLLVLLVKLLLLFASLLFEFALQGVDLLLQRRLLLRGQHGTLPLILELLLHQLQLLRQLPDLLVLFSSFYLSQVLRALILLDLLLLIPDRVLMGPQLLIEILVLICQALVLHVGPLGRRVPVPVCHVAWEILANAGAEVNRDLLLTIYLALRLLMEQTLYLLVHALDHLLFLAGLEGEFLYLLLHLFDLPLVGLYLVLKLLELALVGCPLVVFLIQL